MPQFEPGENKTARVPIRIEPAGLTCEIVLFLGPDENTPVVSASGNFVSTGTQQEVNLSLAMPTAPGTYHVYLDVVTGLVPIASYIAEDVEIEIPGVDLVIGNLAVHSVNGRPFGSVVGTVGITDPPLVVSLLGPLTVNLTFDAGWSIPVSGEYGNTLLFRLYWYMSPALAAAIQAAQDQFWIDHPYTGDLDQYYADLALFQSLWPAYALTSYKKYVTVPTIGNYWATPFDLTVTIDGVLGQGYGPPPRGEWEAEIQAQVPNAPGAIGGVFRVAASY